ncbi:MAG TPA: cytochrome c oxidase assembly protein [Mycobacteriales bacterium]|nr:cytochrome c oxidase assembly protein [Mycobacteriales bacterium]
MPPPGFDGWLPPLTVGRFFTTWSLHPWSAVVCAAMVGGYLAVRRLAVGRKGAWPWRASLAWLTGVTLLAFATQGSLRVYDDSLFWIHMVGHLVLVMVVPVLLVAGRPLDLVVAALPDGLSLRVATVLRGRVISAITNPGVGLILYTAVIAGTHLTGFMNQMMLHPWLGGIEQLMYVTAGVLFFLPLVGVPPIRWQVSAPLRMAMFVVAMPIDTFTGVILGQTNTYPWPAMAAMHPPWAPSLVTDLHAGGAVMWIGGDAIMTVMFGLAAIAWARSASLGEGAELGGWLEAARANYQHGLVGSGSPTSAVSASANPDSDDALDAYNQYLKRLHARRD